MERQQQEREYKRLKNIIKSILHEIKDTYVIWFQSRLKTEESIKEKTQIRKKELNDVIGFRFIYPWTNGLYEISKILQNHKELHIFETKITEEEKVIYMYGKTIFNETYEIQLWPTIIYTCFEYEHDKIYKQKIIPTDKQIQNSIKVRKDEHTLQNLIDRCELVPYES